MSSGRALEGRTVLVAGGTGNVGGFLVAALLEQGANVVVPSRSERKIGELRDHLARGPGEPGLARLHTLVGEIGEEAGARDLLERITRDVAPPDAVVSTLGRFIPAPSLLDASVADLERVLRGYVSAHFVTARTFLPGLKSRGGVYVFINGPLAFEPWEGSGAGLVSIATSAQHMLFRALAQELEGSQARVVELVTHAFIRERQTQPGSPLTGEQLGAFLAALVSDAGQGTHGRSIQLRSPQGLKDLGP